jgi:hypothetical protein
MSSVARAELSAGLVARLRSTRRPRRRASTMPISRNARTCRLVVDLLRPSTRANSVKLNSAAPSARTICVRLGSQSTVRTRSRSDEASPSRRAACAARTRPLGGPAGGKPLDDDSTLAPPHWQVHTGRSVGKRAVKGDRLPKLWSAAYASRLTRKRYAPYTAAAPQAATATAAHTRHALAGRTLPKETSVRYANRRASPCVFSRTLLLSPFEPCLSHYASLDPAA